MTPWKGLARLFRLVGLLAVGVGVGGCGSKSGPPPVSGATFEAAAFDEATWD